MEYLFLLTGLIVGIGIGFLLAKRKKSSDENSNANDNNNIDTILHEKDKQLAILEERLSKSKEIFTENKLVIEQLRAEKAKNASEAIEWRSKYEASLEKLSSQKIEIEKIQKEFSNQFEVIANRILDEKSEKFTKQNKDNLSLILTPFKERIKDFEKSINEKYIKESESRNLLKAEINQLMELNRKISEEAHNLTTALKGDSKIQGNWGELILERVLENSGLIKGQEYDTQFSTKSDEGSVLRPDIIIYLPDKKHIIIDSKVSLTAYEMYVNSSTDEDGAQHLKDHLISLKRHIKELGEKNYQSSVGVNSPDFVLMFIPIESSFSISLREDSDLYNYAWSNKVVIVSPSTCLATLRTIASVWKQERQNKNAEEIARQAGALYDKFVGFITDMENIKKGITTSSKSFDEAMNKLSDGKGNLIRRTENLRTLGVKSKHNIDEKYLDSSLELENEN